MGLEFGIDLWCCIERKSLQLLCLILNTGNNKLFPVRKGVSAQTPDHSQSVAGNRQLCQQRERISVTICLMFWF